MRYDTENPWKSGHRAMHRHHRRWRGHGPFAGGFADAAGIGANFRTGRKLGAADLQLVVLALLQERPRHGYELIKELEERSGGFYSPSPGMIYPALTYLEEIGHAEVESEGTKKLYRITAAGEARLKEDSAIAEAILAQLASIGQKMERVREAFAGDQAEAGLSEALRAARRELRGVLRDRRHASAEEQLRIANILERAVAEIRAK